MRHAFVLLLPVLLAGCVRDSATYYISGNTHTITVRAEQEYFWDKRLNLTLAAARLPECQRVFPLTQTSETVEMQLLDNGEDMFTLRSPEGNWTFETRSCTMLAPGNAPGELVGTYTLKGAEMVFTPARQDAAPRQ